MESIPKVGGGRLTDFCPAERRPPGHPDKALPNLHAAADGSVPLGVYFPEGTRVRKTCPAERTTIQISTGRCQSS